SVVAVVEEADNDRAGVRVHGHARLRLGTLRLVRVLGIAVVQVVVIDSAEAGPRLAAVVGIGQVDVGPDRIVPRVAHGERVGVLYIGDIQPALELAKRADRVVRGDGDARVDAALRLAGRSRYVGVMLPVVGSPLRHNVRDRVHAAGRVRGDD